MRRFCTGGLRIAAHPVSPVWLIACWVLVLAAQAAAQATTGQPSSTTPASPDRGFFGFFLDNLFAISILFIFLGAIIGAVLNARRRDRVLKDFSDYHVTAVLQDGRRVWGKFRTFPNGIEFRYRQPYRNPIGNVHNSFILYQTEYPAVRAVLRLASDLSPENRERRLDDLVRYYNPTIMRRFWRWSRKQFSILRDAFMKSFSLLIGQAKKVAHTSSMAGAVLTTQDKQLTEIGSTVISSVNLMNDPILEGYIGRWCVAETKEGDGWREIPGILKEYSTDWIELLEASWPRDLTIALDEGEDRAEAPEANCVVRREGGAIILENYPPEPLELIEYTVQGETRTLSRRQLPPGESARIDLGGEGNPKVLVRLQSLEPADVVLPRAMTVVRHAGRREHISWLQSIGLRRKSPKVSRAERIARKKLTED